MKTRVTDPFGLASSVRTSAPDARLLVLPRVDVIPAPPQPGGSIAERMDRSPSRVGATGDEFSSLRAYATGDDLRKVHWPSSARLGELVIRNELIPEHGHSLIVLDVRSAVASAEAFEAMVSAAASVVLACQVRGDRIRFVTTDGVDHSADTPNGCAAILDLLALVSQSNSTSMSFPTQLGSSGVEAGVIICGGDSDALVRTVAVKSSTGAPSTYVVRFRSRSTGATPGPAAEVSKRFIDVEPDDDFATSWAGVVGR